MKKVVFIIPIFLFFLSCSSDEDEQPEEELIACFEINNTTLEVGEELQITNCSVGASSISFDFGNGIKTTEESPSFYYDNSGEYTIQLRVISASGVIKNITKSVSVNTTENSFLFPPILSESASNGILNFSIVNNTFYYIEVYDNDILSNAATTFNYVEVDIENNDFSKKYIADKQSNSGNAFLNILSNNEKLVYATSSFSNEIGLTEIKLNVNWENTQTSNQPLRVLYGSLENDNDYLYYGAYRNFNISDPDYSLYKSPSIEIRNDLGELLERKTFNNQIEQGFIGDLIKTNSGFIAFGGTTTPLTFNTFKSYRPLIIYLDNNYDYVSHIAYDNTSISATNFNNLNGSFHIDKLSNGHYVTYSHNEFRIINQLGDEVLKENLPDQSRIQGLISIENEGFILSRENYLDKYDVNGNLVKSIRFNGRHTPNLVLDGNGIYFASGFSFNLARDNGTFSLGRSFIGAVDKDLTLINLN